MILATTLCLAWIVINLFIMIPKQLSREENLFLFLSSSITIMLSLLIPAKRMYFGDPGFNYSIEGTVAFLINRNIIFPLLTLISINLVHYKSFWKRLLIFLVSLCTFLLFCRLDEKHTIVSTISSVKLSIYFICYFAFMLALSKAFRNLGEKQQLPDK
ncbi:hypothetical protein ABWW58_13030 [Sporolactobacillus sp. STCC-11]|uniref:hypothetical protein n=1 Tax=Sporolactobacillus caesalpiniae TaxID=3230362 RepID=UPI00339A196F